MSELDTPTNEIEINPDEIKQWAGYETISEAMLFTAIKARAALYTPEQRDKIRTHLHEGVGKKRLKGLSSNETTQAKLKYTNIKGETHTFPASVSSNERTTSVQVVLEKIVTPDDENLIRLDTPEIDALVELTVAVEELSAPSDNSGKSLIWGTEEQGDHGYHTVELRSKGPLPPVGFAELLAKGTKGVITLTRF